MAASGMGQTESRQQLNRRNEDVSKMKAELSIEHAAKKTRLQVWSIGIFSGETLSDIKPIPGIDPHFVDGRWFACVDG